MATLNVGAMAARLGLDPSDFLDKMKGVQGFNGFASAEMSRQWKKSGRDGQEGMRLIDEALGIHVARPVARIVSETFPALGKAMSSILPGVAFSALGFAILEFAAGAVKKMDEAKKKQAEYTEAVEHTKEVIGEMGATHDRTMKEIELRAATLASKPGAKAQEVDFKINTASAEQAKKQIDEIATAMAKEAKAATEAKKWTTEFWLAAGYVVDNFFSNSSAQADRADAQFGKFRHALDEIMQTHAGDPLVGLRASLKATEAEIATTGADIAKKITAIAAAEALAAQLARSPRTAAVHPDSGVDKDVLEKEKTYFENLKRELQALTDALEESHGKRDNEAIAAAKQHTDELRSELEQIQRLGETSRASAASAMLLAEATGKGTAASIRAAAAAEAEKKILDATAEAHTKLFGDTHQPVGNDKRVQDALAAYAVIERQTALTNQAAKAEEEFGRKLGELSTHDDERIAALHAEADGHSKLANEQARELATLVPLRQALQQLKDLRASLHQPAIGPPTALAAGLDAQIGRGKAGLKAESDKKTNVMLPAMQAAAFNEELKKINEQSAVLAGAGVSPWAKIAAEIKKLVADGTVLPSQIGQITAAFLQLQGARIIDEFEKLDEKLKEVRIETAALASGSPFAKLAAEAQKIGHEFGLSAVQIEEVRQKLIAVQAAENAGKAYGAASDMSAGGAKMQELREQMDALRALSAGGGVGMDGSKLDLAAIKLEMQAIQEEEDKILLKTGGIEAGFKAWADGLQRVKSEGEFTFEMLEAATKGFEDNMAKSWIDILEVQRKAGESSRQEHQRLIKELQSMWSNYFNNLAEMAMKHGIEKLMAPLGGMIAKKIPGLGGVFGGGKDAAETANTTALGTNTAADTTNTAALGLNTAAETANTSALISLTGALMAASAGDAAGAGGGIGDSIDAAMPGNAAGTDDWRGGPTWVGELGPEILNLPRGSQVTPNDVAAKAGGSVTNIHYDQRGAVVTDDLMRKGDAARMISASKSASVQEAVMNSSEIARRSPRPR